MSVEQLTAEALEAGLVTIVRGRRHKCVFALPLDVAFTRSDPPSFKREFYGFYEITMTADEIRDELRRRAAHRRLSMEPKLPEWVNVERIAILMYEMTGDEGEAQTCWVQ